MQNFAQNDVTNSLCAQLLQREYSSARQEKNYSRNKKLLESRCAVPALGECPYVEIRWNGVSESESI